MPHVAYAVHLEPYRRVVKFGDFLDEETHKYQMRRSYLLGELL